MNLFIDTNIFLSFYHFASDDLEELKKLGILIQRDELNLLLPEQVIDEFERNRDNKITDAIKTLRKQSLSLKFPQICKDYDEYSDLRNHQKEYEKLHSELIEKISEDVINKSLKADNVVQELFYYANLLDVSDEILEKAKIRMERGNPPGKSGSLGDAINWELLLTNTTDEEDLHFVTDDKDYSSSFEKEKFNSFLNKEWTEKKGSNIIFYKRLSSFFKEEFPDIQLASELEKDLLIQELRSSSNFSSTHSVIAKLNKYDEFSNTQINDIVSAATGNNQVYWIIGDEDIFNFITSLIDGNEERIDEVNLHLLQKYLIKWA